MADTTITLSSVGIGGSGNTGEMAFFSAATTISGASGIAVINVAGASTMGFGAAPSTVGAINIDGATYPVGIVFSTTAVIRGGTNGFQIQNSGATRNNFSIDDSGGFARLTNGTNTVQFGVTAITGEVPAGGFIPGVLASNLTLTPSNTGNIGSKVVLAYFDQTQFRSGVELANPASFPGTLLLMKSGGKTTHGGSCICLSSAATEGTNFGLGYGVGAGGTVTQLTSKATSFTLNTATGQITFNNSALVAFAASSATWTCSAMGSADVVIFNHVSGGTVGEYTFNVACSAGSGVVTIRNIGSGSLSEAPVVNYAIIKGAQS